LKKNNLFIYMMNHIVSTFNNSTHIIIRTLLCTVAVLFCLYVFLIHATVQHIATRKSIEEKSALLNSHMSTLESKLLALREDLTWEHAEALGYVASNNTIFIKAEQALSFAEYGE